MKITIRKNMPLLLSYILLFGIIQMILSYTIGGRPSTIVLYGFLIIVIFPFLGDIIKDFDLIDFFLLVFFVMVGLISVSTLPTEQDVYFSIFLGVLYKCFPYYFLGKLIAKNDESYDFLRIVPVIAVVLFTVALLVAPQIFVAEDEGYSQGAGYAFLPAAVIALVYFSNNGKRNQLIYAIILGIAIAIGGARGPIFCVLLSIVFLIITKINFKKTWIRLFVAFILILSAIGVYFFFNDNIFEWLYELRRILYHYNVSPRILNIILAGKRYDSGRSNLYQGAFKEISDHFLGVGMFRDRQIMSKYMGAYSGSTTGNYPHNIVLEILIQYGVFFGPAILIILISLLYKVGKSCGDNELPIFIVLMSIGMFPLFISSSYLLWDKFYLLLGFSVERYKMGILNLYKYNNMPSGDRY